MTNLDAIAATVVPLVTGQDPPVLYGTLGNAFEAWQNNHERRPYRRRWYLVVPGDGMPASFDGDLTPLARTVLAAVLPLLDGSE